MTQATLFKDSPSRARPSAERQRSYDGAYMVAGRIAEEIILEFIRRRPNVIGIEDFRGLRVLHQADVDCLVYTTDGRVPLVEIKSDHHLGVSGNVLFELLRVNHTCTPEKAGGLGWSFRSPATYFMFYAPQKKAVYRCRADAFRRCFQSYTRRERERTPVKWVNTDNIKSTLVGLLPWECCKHIFDIYDVAGIAKDVEIRMKEGQA